MSTSTVAICLLFPDLLGTYGDTGNARILSRRLEWRGIPHERIEVSMTDEVPDQADIYLLGGGEDQPQSAVTDLLRQSGALHRAVDRGAVVFAVCAGMQILGKSFAVAGGEIREGLGLLDVTSDRGPDPRCVGEVVVQPDSIFGSEPLTGYENHGGRTILGTRARPLGTVISGWGNNDGLKSEGAIQDKIVGTYLHGPALARNAKLADALLEMATNETLLPLDDAEIDSLRNERLLAISESARRYRK